MDVIDTKSGEVINTKSGVSVAIIDTPKTCSECTFLFGKFCTLTDEVFYTAQDGWRVDIDNERFKGCLLINI